MDNPEILSSKRPVRLKFGRFSIAVPASRLTRIVLGILLCLGGFVGFLPILGFWMLPLGLIMLSIDLAPARRLRRRVEVWWGRRKSSRNGN